MGNLFADLKVRAAVIIRQISQATTACLISMTKGNLGSLTWAHWKLAIVTGLGMGFISLLASFGNLIRFQTTRFGVAAIALVGTAISDYFSHATFPEALGTGIGAALLSLMLSLTPLDQFIETLEEKVEGKEQSEIEEKPEEKDKPIADEKPEDKI